MSMCACTRSRSWCEFRGCKARGQGYYAESEPFNPRYYARQIDDNAMVLIDNRRQRIVSVPGPPELVVPTIFDLNRRSGGAIFVEQWGHVDESF